MTGYIVLENQALRHLWWSWSGLVYGKPKLFVCFTAVCDNTHAKKDQKKHYMIHTSRPAISVYKSTRIFVHKFFSLLPEGI